MACYALYGYGNEEREDVRFQLSLRRRATVWKLTGVPGSHSTDRQHF